MVSAHVSVGAELSKRLRAMGLGLLFDAIYAVGTVAYIVCIIEQDLSAPVNRRTESVVTNLSKARQHLSLLKTRG